MNTRSEPSHTSFLVDHIPQAIIAQYEAEDPALGEAERLEIAQHLEACETCKIVRCVTRWALRSQRQRERALPLPTPESNVTRLIHPEFYQLSRAMLNDPSSAYIIETLEDIYHKHWVALGLPSEATLTERVEDGDEVFFAMEGESADPPKIMGILCGRLSCRERPSYRELRMEYARGHAPRSLNFYTVVVPHEYQGHGMGRRLLLFCGKLFRIYPGITIQSLSPAVGLRRYLIWKLGIGNTKDDLKPVDDRSIDETLAHLGKDRAVIEEVFGQSTKEWLMRLCRKPEEVFSMYVDADADVRAAMAAILEAIANEYANAWFLDRGHDVALGCGVSHFHRLNGGIFRGAKAFSRLDDFHDFGLTLTFEYHLENLDEQVEHYNSTRHALKTGTF